MKSLDQFRNRTKDQEIIEEAVKATSDYKIGPSGKKVKAHRFKVGDESQMDSDDVADTKDKMDIKESSLRSDPPFVLMLKRKAIRMYPDGTHVALYWNDLLKKYFSVPYESPKGVTGYIQAEKFDALDILNSIINEDTCKEFIFESGENKLIDVETANVLMDVYESLSENNKQKFLLMVNESVEQFDKAYTFASKHSK